MAVELEGLRPMQLVDTELVKQILDGAERHLRIIMYTQDENSHTRNNLKSEIYRLQGYLAGVRVAVGLNKNYDPCEAPAADWMPPTCVK